MEIKLNGEPRTFPEDRLGIEDLLRSIGVDPEQSGMAVAINYSVIPRSSWAEVGIEPGDEVEVIVARQGG